MSAIDLGPFVLSIERFAALLGVIVFVAVAELFARSTKARTLSNWSSTTVFWGFIGARLGHVIEFWPSFAEEPWRILAIWQGGFSVAGAAVGVAAVTAWALWRSLPVVPAASALCAGVIVWQAILLDVAPREPVALPGDPLATIEGESLVLTSLVASDKPIIINLWATWCPPCRRELPMLATVAAQRDDVVFLLASQGGTAAHVSRYLAEHDLQPEHVLIDTSGMLARHYGTVGLPVTLFIGTDGLLAHTHVGEISREVLLSRIARLQ
ncbi:TlpA family protein disulfide reductase [Rhodobacterales bacterium HKCCA1288]|nr:TlpA family protein disulfide reductase [Rhodobacterales bacterium HKCCA1288]